MITTYAVDGSKPKEVVAEEERTIFYEADKLESGPQSVALLLKFKDRTDLSG